MLIQADARRIPIKDGCIQCVVTSPPYWGLRDYGTAEQIGLERTPDDYVREIVAVFREVRRVLTSDGVLWLNLGDCYATGAGAVGNCPGGGEQGARWAGDQYQGHRGSRGGSPKQRHTGAAVGPMTQPNRMPLPGLKPKDLVGIPWRVAFALQADGWYLRSDVIWSKPNPMPESTIDRPTKAHEYVFLLTKNERYYYDAEAIKEPANAANAHDATGAGYDAPGQKPHSGSRSGNKTRKYGDDIGRPGSHLGSSIPWEGFTRNRRSVWSIATRPYSGAHFATMPEKLAEPCILAGSRIGDRVLDPFMGSGTVGAVAERLGRRWVGLDLNRNYHALARKRTAQRGLMFEAVTS